MSPASPTSFQLYQVCAVSTTPLSNLQPSTLSATRKSRFSKWCMESSKTQSTLLQASLLFSPHTSLWKCTQILVSLEEPFYMSSMGTENRDSPNNWHKGVTTTEWSLVVVQKIATSATHQIDTDIDQWPKMRQEGYDWLPLKCQTNPFNQIAGRLPLNLSPGMQ